MFGNSELLFLRHTIQTTTQIHIDRVYNFSLNAHQQQAALASDNAQMVYLALWSIAFTDAIQAIESAKIFLQHPQTSHRLVM